MRSGTETDKPSSGILIRTAKINCSTVKSFRNKLNDVSLCQNPYETQAWLETKDTGICCTTITARLTCVDCQHHDLYYYIGLQDQ